MLTESKGGTTEITYAYDGTSQKGLLSTVTDANSRTITYAYTDRGPVWICRMSDQQTALGDVLKTFWTTVVQSDNDDASKLADDFLTTCIKPEFHTKFRREFDTRHKIGVRFFKYSWEMVSTKDLPNIVSADMQSRVHADVVFGNMRHSDCYSLSGTVSSLSGLFVLDLDSIARIAVAGQDWFAFHSDAVGACFVWKRRKTSSPQGHNRTRGQNE